MTMLRQVWRIDKAGSLDRLRLQDEALPEPSPGAARVRVEAVGLNFADVFACLGLYSATPAGAFIPGLEYAGTIEAFGPGAEARTDLRVGDRVVGRGDPVAVIPPGVHGYLQLENGTAAELVAGAHSFCGIIAGRHARLTVQTGVPTTIDVAGDIRLGNDGEFGRASGAPLPHVRVASGTVVIAAGVDFAGSLAAPTARVLVGRGATVFGDICADTLLTGRNVTLPVVPMSCSARSWSFTPGRFTTMVLPWRMTSASPM